MDKQRSRWGLALVLAVAAVTVWAVWCRGDAQPVWRAMQGAKAGWLAAGAGLMMAAIGCEALGTCLTLATLGCPMAYHRCFGCSVAGFYFSSVTPSATGGQPAQVYYMTKFGVPAAVGTLDLLLLTACYQTVSVTYALLAWIACPHPALGRGFGALLGYGVVSMTLLTAGVLVLLFRPGPACRLAQRLLEWGAGLRLVRDKSRARRALEDCLNDYHRAAATLRSVPWLFPALLGVTALQLTCVYLVPWTVYRALALSGVGVGTLVCTQALVALAVGCLPIPGSAGAAEGAFLTAFAGVFGPALVSPAMLLSRGESFYLPLLLTALGTLLLHKSTR